MTTGQDDAFDTLEKAVSAFDAHRDSMTPAEQAAFLVSVAQVYAAIETRRTLGVLARVLARNDLRGLRDDLKEFTGTVNRLAGEVERFNDGHGF